MTLKEWFNKNKNYNYLQVKKIIENKKELLLDDYKYYTKKSVDKEKIDALLKEYNYTLQEVEEVEKVHIYGAGVIKMEDGNRYQIHFQKNGFSQVSKEDYNKLKGLVGQDVNMAYPKKVYKETPPNWASLNNS